MRVNDVDAKALARQRSDPHRRPASSASPGAATMGMEASPLARDIASSAVRLKPNRRIIAQINITRASLNRKHPCSHAVSAHSDDSKAVYGGEVQFAVGCLA